MDDSLVETLRDLETQLLTPDVRRSPEAIGRLLADGFVEFGSSGKVYRKQDCAGGMATPRMSLSHFEVRLLAPGVALATYRVARHDVDSGDVNHSLRC